MKELIKMWLTKIACCHTWELESTYMFTYSSSGVECGRIKVYVCKNCGKFHRETFGEV